MNGDLYDVHNQPGWYPSARPGAIPPAYAGRLNGVLFDRLADGSVTPYYPQRLPLGVKKGPQLVGEFGVVQEASPTGRHGGGVEYRRIPYTFFQGIISMGRRQAPKRIPPTRLRVSGFVDPAALMYGTGSQPNGLRPGSYGYIP